MDQLGMLRNNIDKVDNTIMELISMRMELARSIGLEKKKTGKAIEDEDRETSVRDKWQKMARENGISDEDALKLSEILIRICKGVQEE